MSRVFLGLLGGFVAAAILLVGVVREWRLPGEKESPAPTVTPTPLPVGAPVPQPSTDAEKETLLVVRDDNHDGAWEDILLVANRTVRAVPVPSGVVRTVRPATDGSRIYILKDVPVRPRGTSRQLVALALDDGEETLISDATPLVTPGTIVGAPNGAVIAFFLDSATGDLTEVWTVDPATAQKRLALERLTKNVAGPFWAPDGGFLVRDGGTLLRGSPHRTGGDVLPVQRSWNDLVPGDTMLPSPGGTQVVYVTNDADGFRLHLRVWDFREKREREVFSFPGNGARLLGWNASGALVVAAAADTVTIWDVRKEGQQPFPLSDGASSPVLSGDGTAIGYILADAGNDSVVLVDHNTKKEIARVPLPPSREPSPSPQVEDEVPRPVYHLVQFVRTGAPGRSAASTGGTLAPEDAVRYVMEHVREIAEAPPAEAVAAERVWFTNTPGAVLVDYRVGTALWRRLVRLQAVGEKPTGHEILGVFTPAAGEWVLARGKNLPDPRPTLLYEFEPELNKWVQKETVEDIQP